MWGGGRRGEGGGRRDHLPSLRRSRENVHTHTHSLSLSHTHSFSLSLSHTHSLSLSLSHNPYMWGPPAVPPPLGRERWNREERRTCFDLGLKGKCRTSFRICPKVRSYDGRDRRLDLGKCQSPLPPVSPPLERECRNPQLLKSQQRFHFCFETFHSRLLSRWVALLARNAEPV